MNCTNLTRRRAILLFALFATCPMANAQTNVPPPQLPSALFGEAITTLCREHKITIIAEGGAVAFDEAITKTGAYKIASPERKVSLLAKAADYAVKNTRGTFLLTKNYSDPRDTPCVTIEECHTSLKQISSLLSTLLPSLTVSRGTDADEVRLQNFFRSLSAEQLNKAKESPLPTAQLTAAQKEAATVTMASTYLDRATRTAQEALGKLERLPKATLHKHMVDNQAVIGYRAAGERDAVYQLGNFYYGRSMDVTTPRPATLPFAPAPSTIGAEFARLHKREKTDTAVAFDAGTAYADKPLSVGGLERLTPEQVASAIAAVYDLRLKTVGTVRRLTPRPRLASVSVFNVREAVFAALPAPLARVLTAETDSKYLPAAQRALLDGTEPDFVKTRTIVLYLEEAERGLRKTHEKKLDAAHPKGVAVADLPAPDRQAVAVAALGGFVDGMSKLLNFPVPDYIARFDELHFTARRYRNEEDGKTKISIIFYLPLPDQPGKFHDIMGHSNISDVESSPPNPG